MFDSSLPVERHLHFFQSSYLCYIDKPSIMELFLCVLTVTIWQQNSHIEKYKYILNGNIFINIKPTI